MSTVSDISATLAAIDAAVGCHQCGGELGASPSNDFCSELCSKAWAAGRVGATAEDEPLGFYRQRWMMGVDGPAPLPAFDLSDWQREVLYLTYVDSHVEPESIERLWGYGGV